MRLLLKRAAVGAIALAVSVSLAGCDEDDGPNSAPPSDSSSVPETSSPTEPTTTPTETGPVEPTLPAEAEAATKAGAVAFASYYWEVVNYAQATGDTALLKSVSIEDCGGCNGGRQSIDRIYQRGGRIIGGRNRVIQSELLPKPSGGWVADQTIQVGRQRIQGAGDLDQVSAAGRVKLLLGVAFQDGAWFVTSLEV